MLQFPQVYFQLSPIELLVSLTSIVSNRILVGCHEMDWDNWDNYITAETRSCFYFFMLENFGKS